MKKAKMLFFLVLTAALTLGGCGESNPSQPVIHPNDIATPMTESSLPEETAPEDGSGEKNEDIPPEEGMVRSNLTGLWVDATVADSRPIAVMFPTDKGSQPQYSIGAAGILYECMEEGGVSRQMGIIEDWQGMERIGNIRSSRDYYGYWSMEWDAFLVCWGGPFYLADLANRSEFDYLAGASIGVPEKNAPALGSEAFWRSDPKNPTIHNGYTDGESLSKAINKLGFETDHREKYYEGDHFQFASFSNPNTLENSPNSFDASTIDLSKVFGTTRSSLEYNEEEGVYYKTLHGDDQMDKVTGEQLTFTNVIVQNTYWEYQVDGKYLAFQCIDNTNDGYFFTKGKGIHISWEKTSDYSATRYYDDNGKEIQLNPGKTYIAVAQEGKTVIYE